MSDYIDINEGLTGSNGFPATLFGFVGIIFLTISFPISILSFVLCGILAGMTEGVEFYRSNKTYRKYYKLFYFRFGKWKSIPLLDFAELKMNIRSVKVTRWLPKSASYRDQLRVKESLRTFDIELISNSERIKFYEFNSYSNARKTLEALGELCHIPIQDHFLDDINSSED